MARARMRLAVVLLAATACGGSAGQTSDDTTTPAVGLCSTIRLGGPVDVALLESGCSDPDRNTIYILNHTKCRSGTDFGTFDLKDATGTVDQLFAYNGTWHSTNNEGDLYSKARDECL